MPLTIRMKSADTAEMLLYDFIGADFFSEGVTAKRFRAELKALKAKNLNLRVNSPGGDVFEAAAILAALDEFPGEITVDVDGLAASAASVIIMAGDTINVASNGMIMIHNPHAGIRGDSAEMRRVADLLDQVQGQILDTYMRRAKPSRDAMKAAMDAETWYTGADAVAAGLADTVTEPVRAAAVADVLGMAAKLKFQRTPEPPKDARAQEETRKRREIAAKLAGKAVVS